MVNKLLEIEYSINMSHDKEGIEHFLEELEIHAEMNHAKLISSEVTVNLRDSSYDITENYFFDNLIDKQNFIELFESLNYVNLKFHNQKYLH